MWNKACIGIAGLSVAGCWLCGCAGSQNQQWSSKQASIASTPAAQPEPLRLRPAVSAPEPPVVALNVNAEAVDLQQAATSLLLEAAGSPDPQLRANAIESLHHAPLHVTDVVRRGLGDPNRGVRYVAAMTVGKLGLTELAPLIQPLLHDESPSVRAAAIYALRRNGRKVDPSPLAAMALGDDPEAKGNAIFILGELQNPSATDLLRQSTTRGFNRMTPARRRVIELQAAEAMVKLGVHQQLDPIRAALFARAEEGEIAALAAQMAGELRDGAVINTLLDLATRTGKRQQSAEVRIACALATAKIDPNRAPVNVVLGYVGHERPEIRAQAAHALGAMAAAGVAEPGGSVLARMLSDTSPQVQVAAAGALVKVGSVQSHWGLARESGR